MPGQRHGPVQGKLHPRRGAGIELPTSLRQRFLRERRHTTLVILSGGSLPLARTPLLTTPSAGGQHLGACSLVRMATKVGPQTPAPQRPACFRKKLLLNVKKRRLLKKNKVFLRKTTCLQNVIIILIQFRFF